MHQSEKALILLVRLEGAILLLALPGAFLPTDWMAAVHEWAGLGEFPRRTVVEYLTRSLSALYATWAPLYLYVASDIRRYLSLLAFLAIFKFFFALGMTVLDVSLGMPVFWTLGEGPAIMIFSVAQFWLARRAQAPSADHA